MQHFDNLESGRNDYADSSHYRDEDFDEYVRGDDFGEADLYYSRNNKKHRYEEELKQFYFTYEDYHGYEQELFTTVECVWKITPGTFSYDAPSDVDYYGYSELTAWKVISVENSDGDEVNPEEVLTDMQLETYNTAMLNFVEK